MCCSRCGSVLTLLALAALSAAAAAPEPKYRLREVSAVGDLVEKTSRLPVSLRLKAPPGRKHSTMAAEGGEYEKYREEVLAVDDRGKPVAVRRTYLLKRSVDLGWPVGDRGRASSLQGKTVEIRREDDQVVVTALKGKISDADRRELAGAVDDANLRLLPDRDLGPGDEWTVEPARARALFRGATGATLKCRLQD